MGFSTGVIGFMNENIQAVIAFGSVASIAYGLWLLHPAAMYCGVGGLLLTGIVVTRTLSGKSKKC